jgi:hypothetical protein
MIFEPASVRPVDFLPRRQTEANLQAEFYSQAKARGLSVFLEYPSRWNESPGARFDAVIHKAGKIRAICEIKRSGQPEKRRRSWPNSRQGKVYLSWNVPVFLIIEPADFLGVWQWAARAGLIGPGLPPPAAGGTMGGLTIPQL